MTNTDTIKKQLKFQPNFQQSLCTSEFPLKDHEGYATDSTVNYPPTQAQIQEYEKLDKLRLEGISAAERQCRKYKMGNVPWSPFMGGLWNQIYAWDMIIRKKKGRRISSRFLKLLLTKAGVLTAYQLNLQECQKRRQTIFRYYLQEKPKADAIRKTFQEGLAEALAEKHDSTKEKQLKQLRLREDQRSAARQSKAVRHKLRAG